MPTLEELRCKFRDPGVRRKKVSKPEIGGRGLSRAYRINPDGDDALLLFGKFSGSRVSEMLVAPRKKRYLGWILRNDFPDDLKSVVRYLLEVASRKKK